MNVSDTTWDLHEMVSAADRIGQSIDIRDAHYGPASWGKKEFVTAPSPYYYFLAGWCTLTKASKVIEVGTHFGGSTLALLAGMDKTDDARLVTMDVTDLNKERLAEEPIVTKIVGSGADADIQEQAVSQLNGAGCDLLYVDALKDQQFVFDVLEGFAKLTPIRYAILDDINITASMRSMWAEVRERYGDDALDITESHPSVRAENVGFGVIRMTK